jgi:hypothetical protein
MRNDTTIADRQFAGESIAVRAPNTVGKLG